MYDTFGIEKLEQCLNLSLKEIKIQSFIFDNVETTVYRLYLKFNNWLSLFFDDGVLFIKDENPETIFSALARASIFRMSLQNADLV